MKATRQHLALFCGSLLAFLLGASGSARAQSLIHSGLPMPYFTSHFCCDVYAGNILANWSLGPLSMQGRYPTQLTMAARLALTYGSISYQLHLCWPVFLGQHDTFLQRWMSH